MPKAVWAGDGFGSTPPASAHSSAGLAGPEAHAWELGGQRKKSWMLRDLRVAWLLWAPVWKLFKWFQNPSSLDVESSVHARQVVSLRKPNGVLKDEKAFSWIKLRVMMIMIIANIF